MTKSIFRMIPFLSVFFICGCSTLESQLISSTMNADSINHSHTTAEATLPITSPVITKRQEEFIFFLDGNELSFYFDMSIEEAIMILAEANIGYQQTDDHSAFRCWSGYHVKTDTFSLIFDMQGSLHEIIVSQKVKSSLPIAVDDLVIDLPAILGKEDAYAPMPDSFGAVGSLYYEYGIDNYYLKAVFYEERIQFEKLTVYEIIISKYSVKQYQELREPATLIFTKKGKQAEFYIGMSLDDVKAQLDALEIRYTISNGVLSGSSYDYLPENGAPDGFYCSIYFDLHHPDYYVCTIETFGPGVLTPLGLQDDDPEEKILDLYGEDFKKMESGNDYWKNYCYISGDNYLNISTSTELDPSAPVTMLEISRYTVRGLKDGVSYISGE